MGRKKTWSKKIGKKTFLPIKTEIGMDIFSKELALRQKNKYQNMLEGFDIKMLKTSRGTFRIYQSKK